MVVVCKTSRNLNCRQTYMVLNIWNIIYIFNYYYYSLIRVFRISVSSSLSDSKSPQFSRTLLSILVVLNNAVVWMVSTRPPNSKSSSPFSNPRSRCLSFFSHSFSFIRDSKVNNFADSLSFFFFCCWLLLSLVFWPRSGDPCVYQIHIGVYVCPFLGQVLGCAYTICLYGQI